MRPGPKATDPAIRFWAKVERRGPDECWLWQAGKQGSGYGQFYPVKHRPMGAHRFAWSLANGQPIPAGMLVMHSCDNPPCVNPAHLSVGTTLDNRRDCSSKRRNPGNRTTRGRPTPKWSPEVVDAMRKQGMFYRDIGKALGIAGSTAYRTHQRLI